MIRFGIDNAVFDEINPRRAHDVCDLFAALDPSLGSQHNIKVLSFGVVAVRCRSNRILVSCRSWNQLAMLGFGTRHVARSS
jgi:hypothetical protein